MGESNRLLRWVLGHVWPLCLSQLALTLGLAAAALLPAWFFQCFVTSLSGGSSGSALVGRLLWFGTGIAVLASALGYLGALNREKLQLAVERLLRVKATRQLLSRPLEAFDGLSRGEFLMRLGADLSKVESFVATSLPNQVRSAGILLLAGFLFVLQAGAVALIPLALVSAVAYFNYRGQRRLMPLFDELRALHGSVYQDMLQTFESVRTIRTHGASERHVEGFTGKVGAMGRKSLRVVALASLFDGANTFSYQVMTAGCLAFAAWRVGIGGMDLATALGLPFYLGFFYSSAESLAGAVGEWQRFAVESSRLAEFLSSEAPAARESTCKDIAAEDLRIGYAGRLVAGPFNLRAEVGSTTVVLGPSGCGKSTLLDVIAGLRAPLGGRVEAADCAIVEQRACLWEGTIRDNLLGSREDARIWKALETCGLAGLVTQLGGLDAVIHDRGANLSEGQRYRLAIARALLLPQPFLLLDEPFAALDGGSISRIVRALNEGRKRHGFLIVTHQVPTGLQVDRTLDLGRPSIQPPAPFASDYLTSKTPFT